MRGVVPALLVIAACYSPRPPVPGAPCETDSGCPRELRCIANICSDPNATPPPDGSGSGNGSACVASGAQDPDEDGDHLPDRCDPCPLVASNPTTDSDSDGIPDACDPDLTATTHRPHTTWLMEGFRSKPIWAGLGFTLGADLNSLRIDAPGGASLPTVAVLPLPFLSTYEDFRVIVAIRILSATGADPEIGLQLTDVLSSSFAYCQMVQDGTNTSLRYLEVTVETGSGGGGEFPDFDWAVNTDYTLELRIRGSTFECQVKGGSASVPSPASGNLPMAPGGGMAVTIAAYGITATLNWVYVVGSP